MLLYVKHQAMHESCSFCNPFNIESFNKTQIVLFLILLYIYILPILFTSYFGWFLYNAIKQFKWCLIYAATLCWINVCFRHYDDVFTLFNVTYREFKFSHCIHTFIWCTSIIHLHEGWWCKLNSNNHYFMQVICKCKYLLNSNGKVYGIFQLLFLYLVLYLYYE